MASNCLRTTPPVPAPARLPVTAPRPHPLQATRLIMAHMCKEPFSVAAWPMVLIALQVLRCAVLHYTLGQQPL